jgi:alanine racemase
MITPSHTASGVLTVDLNAVAANYRFFRETVGQSCAVAGIVKANAYGLGMAQVAPVLEREGCRQFFVATLDEAIALRGLTAQGVAVLGGFWHGGEDLYAAHELMPVLNSMEDIARWRAFCQRIGRPHPAILHFDTGMNRLGLGPDETQHLLGDMGLLDGLDIKIIMSHFACSDEANHSLTGLQARSFETIATHFPAAVKSLANSSGILRDTAFHYDMVRPGMAVYGLNPLPEQSNPMQPTVSLSTRLLQVRQVDKGQTIGYGASCRFEKPARTGTVALGYADGFLRSGSNNATLYYNGQPCPVLGRVSMDLVTIDLTGLDAQAGDPIEILGPNQDADTLAASLGTIGYEVLTGLGRRWARHYI